MTSLVVPGNLSKGELKTKKRERKENNNNGASRDKTFSTFYSREPPRHYTNCKHRGGYRVQRQMLCGTRRKIKISQDSVRSSEKCPVIR